MRDLNKEKNYLQVFVKGGDIEDIGQVLVVKNDEEYQLWEI